MINTVYFAGYVYELSSTAEIVLQTFECTGSGPTKHVFGLDEVYITITAAGSQPPATLWVVTEGA